MARTAASGFRFWRTLSGEAHQPVPIISRIANSTTLRVGDAVRINTGGFLVSAAVGETVAGILIGFSDEAGINPFSLGYSRSALTLTGDDTLATSATNQTRADFIYGEVVIDPNSLWLNDADEDLDATDIAGYFDIISSARVIDASTVSNANGQMQCVLWDPKGSSENPFGPATADASFGAFKINESQFAGNGLDTATAKRAA